MTARAEPLPALADEDTEDSSRATEPEISRRTWLGDEEPPSFDENDIDDYRRGAGPYEVP